MFICTVLLGTYAVYSWKSGNTDVTFSIGDSYFYCESGEVVDHSGLAPVLDYRNGAVHQFKVNNIGKADTKFSVTLNIKTLDDSLKSESFKYKLIVDKSGSIDCTKSSGCEEVEGGSGNFKNMKVGMNTIVPSIDLPNNSRYQYYLFMYIDGNMQNDVNMQGSKIESTLEVCEIVAMLDYHYGNIVDNKEYLKVKSTYEGLPSNVTRNNTVVSYNTHGGTSVNSDTITYTFDGWYLESNYKTKVTANSEVNTTVNHTLYAKWNPSKTITLPTTTRTGYTFLGWFTSASNGTKVENGYSPDVSTELHAQWKANALNFADQTITKTFSTSTQTASITGATNGTGTYSYSEVSEKNSSGTSTNYISISGTTINIAASTPAGTYSYVIRATDSNSKVTKDATYKIVINKAATANAGKCNSLTYNGASQTLASGGSYVSYSNNSGTDAVDSSGNQKKYSVTVTADSNHTFSGGETSTTLSCTIARRATTCTSGSSSKPWDGSALTDKTGGSCTNLVSGHTATFSGHTGTITNAGSTANTFGSVSISSGSTNVTNNYAITKKNGTLTVTKAATANAGKCNSLTYNGASQTLASGGSYVSYSNNSGTDAVDSSGNQKKYSVTVTADSNHTFSGGETSTTLSCTIARRATTCTSGSSSKPWDGSALTDKTGGSCTNLVSGHTATFSGHTGTITNVGSTANTFGSVSISSGSTNVTNNYAITKKNGTLTVTKAATAKVGSCNSLTYNGGNQTLVSGGQYIKSYGNNSQKNAGTYSDITAYADDNHTFSDGSVTQKMTCSIAKATPTFNVTPGSGTITTSTVTFNENSSAQGVFTNSSNDSSVATVSPTKTSAVTLQDVTVTGGNNGSATITVEFSPSDETNYNKPSSKTYKVTVDRYHTLTVKPNGGVWNGTTNSSTFTQVNGTKKSIGNPSTNAYYTISYNGNGGSTPSSTKAYRSFSSWSLSGGSGKGSFSNGVYTFGTENGTLTANYDTTGKATLASSNKSVIVSYDTNGTGATSSTASQTIAVTGLGWYDAASGGNKIANFGESATFTGNKTLYAHWNSSASVTLATLSKTGYTCKWNTASNGSGTSYVSGATTSISSSITLYAQCTINTYTVTLRVQDDATDYAFILENEEDTATSLSFKVPYGENIKFSDHYCIYSGTASYCAEARPITGYTTRFYGWLDGEQLIDGDSDRIVTVTKDINLVTSFSKTINKYTINYNNNGGTGCSSKINVEYNSSYGDLCTPSRTGYNFQGWYTASSGGTKVTESTIMGDSDVTIYAQWKRNFTCAAKGQTTSYLGKSWYTMSNASGYCELALIGVSSSTGTWNEATTKLTNEYITGTNALLATEYNAGLLEKISGNNVIDSNVGGTTGLTTGSNFYWYQSGWVYNPTAITTYSLNASNVLAGFNFSSKNGALPLLSPTTIHGSCSSSNYTAGAKSFAVTSSSVTLNTACNNSNAYVGSIYQSVIKTDGDVKNADKNNVGILERYYTNQKSEEKFQAHQAKIFKFYPCGGQYNGTLSQTLTAKSSTAYLYTNNHTSTTNSTRQYSNTTYYYVYAGKYTFGSSAGKTLNLRFDTGGICTTYTRRTLGTNTYNFHYRPHIKVKST